MELNFCAHKSKNKVPLFPPQQLISLICLLICVEQLVLCFSGMETRLSGSLLETIALIYGGSSRIFLLPQHRVPVVLIGFHGSQKTPRDETQHIRVWIQRGRELISQTEWEFNQRRSGGGGHEERRYQEGGKGGRRLCRV